MPGPFDRGPFSWIIEKPQFRVIGRTWGRRVILVVLVGWVPLVLLAMLQGNALLSQGLQTALLTDLPAIGRYLVAAPLFVFAEAVYLPQLVDAGRALVDEGFVTADKAARYQALVVSTRRLLTSRVTLVVIVVVTYIVTFAVRDSAPSGAGTWAITADGGLTPAGWWRVLVSHPLFLGLWGTWFWRVLLWARFVWTVARLDLRLIAGHPDRLGGLHFMVIPVQGFAILALGLGAIGAGTLGEAVIVGGQLTGYYRYFIGVHVTAVVAIFAGPLLFLSVPLLRLRNHGARRYGRLASDVGREFERRWIDRNHRDIDAGTLDVKDFSAATDLYSLAARMHEVNVFVLSVRHVGLLAGATLLPYGPVALAVVPMELILELARKTLT